MSNDVKQQQLGMPIGTASNRLRKSVIFSLLSRLDENNCFQCGAKIETADELSIEHKVPYLHSEDPIDLFFSIDNIAFSHLSCNVAAAKRPLKGLGKHPSIWEYMKGCRCIGCRSCNADRMRRIRAK